MFQSAGVLDAPRRPGSILVLFALVSLPLLIGPPHFVCGGNFDVPSCKGYLTPLGAPGHPLGGILEIFPLVSLPLQLGPPNFVCVGNVDVPRCWEYLMPPRGYFGSFCASFFTFALSASKSLLWG